MLNGNKKCFLIFIKILYLSLKYVYSEKQRDKVDKKPKNSQLNWKLKSNLLYSAMKNYTLTLLKKKITKPRPFRYFTWNLLLLYVNQTGMVIFISVE